MNAGNYKFLAWSCILIVVNQRLWFFNEISFMCHFKLAAWVIRVTSPSKEVLLSFAHSWVLAGIYRVCLDRTYFVETENWKHCSKIIFKYVNSIMRPIFNEKIDKKWSLWDLWIVHLCTVHKRPVNSCGWRKKKKKEEKTQRQHV